MDAKLKKVLEGHARGEHFSWSHCPLCWAQQRIKEVLRAPVISAVSLSILLSCGVAEAGGIPTDCGSNGRQDCVMHYDQILGVEVKPVEKCELKMKEAMRLAEKHKEALWSQWASRVETSPESYSSYSRGYTHIRCITVACLQKELDAAKQAEKNAADLKQAKARWNTIYQECVK